MMTYKGYLYDVGLEKTVAEATDVYLRVAEKTEELLKQVLDSEVIQFPVDIQSVADKLDIRIGMGELNVNSGKRFSRVLGRTIMRDGRLWIIVDKKVSLKTQRYAMAHAIGRFLLSKSRIVLESSYAIPLIPQSLEEIEADVVALFLLLPMQTFKNEFASYLEQCKDYPLNVDAWLQHLSDVSQISLFNLSIGYQQLKQVLCYQKQKEFEENGYDIRKMKEDEYSSIFA